MKFPKEVYVRIEDPNSEDAYLVANVDADEFAETGEEIRAGLYRLVEEVVVTAQINVSVDKIDDTDG